MLTNVYFQNMLKNNTKDVSQAGKNNIIFQLQKIIFIVFYYKQGIIFVCFYNSHGTNLCLVQPISWSTLSLNIFY